MLISKKHIDQKGPEGIVWPLEKMFELPEKVLQFGTGVLLRALPDYFIDKANRQGVFNGRVVMVKSTDLGAGGADLFERQDCLYTHCVRGLREGKAVEENILNASVSRVIDAKNDWESVLRCAADPSMQLVISNTTEVGLTIGNDLIGDRPPFTFPGKLLAFLFRRYQAFQGDVSRGMVVIPTELIPQNGEQLRSLLETLALKNQMPAHFLEWLRQANHFCNSLVDRIVPGKPEPALQRTTELRFGYQDELMIMSESYKLWAIESPEEKVREILSFSQADADVVITPDIGLFRELKLRLLNGAHTFCCGLAFLAGFPTVKKAMDHPAFSSFIRRLMLAEIAPAIAGPALSMSQARGFAIETLDRFRNPYIAHAWLNITLQYSSKMQMRNISTIKKYFEKFHHVPELMAFGFAAYLLFTKPVGSQEGKYYGLSIGQAYPIQDDRASYFFDIWKQGPVPAMVDAILLNDELWAGTFQERTGFSQAVAGCLEQLMQLGPLQALEAMTDTFKNDEG